jgi:hypothetical protein
VTMCNWLDDWKGFLSLDELEGSDDVSHEEEDE